MRKGFENNSRLFPKKRMSAAQRQIAAFQTIRRIARIGRTRIVAYIVRRRSLPLTASLKTSSRCGSGAHVSNIGVLQATRVAEAPRSSGGCGAPHSKPAPTPCGRPRSRRAASCQYLKVPLVLFSLLNHLANGPSKKFATAPKCRADGVLLVTDLTPEESKTTSAFSRASSSTPSFSALPTSTDERLANIAACSSGFLYLIPAPALPAAKGALPDDSPRSSAAPAASAQLPSRWLWPCSLPATFPFLAPRDRFASRRRAPPLVSRLKKPKVVDGAAQRLRNAVRSLKDAARHGLSRRRGSAMMP